MAHQGLQSQPPKKARTGLTRPDRRTKIISDLARRDRSLVMRSRSVSAVRRRTMSGYSRYPMTAPNASAKSWRWRSSRVALVFHQASEDDDGGDQTGDEARLPH